MGFLPVALAAISAVHQISQGLTQAAAYENQARAAEAGSRQAALSAQVAESQGRIDAARTSREGYKQLGRQRAFLAQGGVLDSPTGRLVRAEAERQAEEDEFQVQWNAKKQKHLLDSAGLGSRADLARTKASQARFGTLLGGLGSFAGGLNKAYL